MSIKYTGRDLKIFLEGSSVATEGHRGMWLGLSNPVKHFNIILGKKSSLAPSRWERFWSGRIGLQEDYTFKTIYKFYMKEVR